MVLEDIKVITKVGCPYCEKAKELLESLHYDYKEIVVSTKEEFRKYISESYNTTVPKLIVNGNGIIDSYDSLKEMVDNGEIQPLAKFEYRPEDLVYNSQNNAVHFAPATIKTKQREVFNLDNKGFEDSTYPLFLGEDLGLTDTIHQPYPILERLYDMQMGQIWNHLEVDLTKDRQDMLSADPKTVELMVKTISWQWLADSIASRSITGVLMDMVSNSDLESLYNSFALFETIHAKTYSHIVKQTFSNPTQAIKDTYADMEVVQRSNVLRDTFNELANVPFHASAEYKREKLYPALVAMYLLERINFMASFAITFGIAETGIFQGIAQNVKLICRDEILHAFAGSKILEIERSLNPETMKALKPKIREIFYAVVNHEKSWSKYLFSEGRHCIGINAERINKYVDFSAQEPAQLLGIEDFPVVTEDPLPYMKKYIDTKKVQVAAQELQLTSYLIDAIKPMVDRDAFLAKMKAKYGS